jgi:Ca2+/H+ antiporter
MTGEKSFLSTLPRLSILLLLLPVAIGMKLSGGDGMGMFVVSAVAILRAVTLIGKATEDVALFIGVIVVAVVGNAAEGLVAVCNRLLVPSVTCVRRPQTHAR